MRFCLLALILCFNITFSQSTFWEFGDNTESKSSLRALLGDEKGLLVFRANNQIGVVDLSTFEGYVINESSNTYSLSISPDGKRLVYQLGSNTLVLRWLKPDNTEKTTIAQGYEPHWWVDQQSGQEYLVFETVNKAMELKHPDFAPTASDTKYPGETHMIRISGIQTVGEAEVILDQGYKAGLSYDGKWLATGDQSPVVYNRETKQFIPLSYHKQTCWPVLSPSKDPAHQGDLSFVNERHDTLIVRNAKDELVWNMAFANSSLSGGKWHSNGWSNKEDYMSVGYTLPGSTGRIALSFIRPSLNKAIPILWYKDKSLDIVHQDLWLESVSSSIGQLRKPVNHQLIRTNLGFDYKGSNYLLNGKLENPKRISRSIRLQ